MKERPATVFSGSRRGIHDLDRLPHRVFGTRVLALDDAAVPADPELRFTLIAWVTSATAVLGHGWRHADDVPGDLAMSIWSWSGTEGW